MKPRWSVSVFSNTASAWTSAGDPLTWAGTALNRPGPIGYGYGGAGGTAGAPGAGGIGGQFQTDILNLFFFQINYSANAGANGGQAYSDAVPGQRALDGRGCKTAIDVNDHVTPAVCNP